MRVLPVIERELRASARQPSTYWLRVLGVLAMGTVLASLLEAAGRVGNRDAGGRLFAALHQTLLCAIWLLVPLLTADCISRERREGTLPLLFLTPLKAGDVVCSKGLAQGLRALSLWVAVLPIISISLLIGGVGPVELAMSALVNGSSLCLAMAAGILASSVSRSWNRALALAVCLALLFGLLMLGLLPLFVLARGGFKAPPPMFMFYYQGPALNQGSWFISNAGGMWQHWASLLRGGPWTLLRGYLLFGLGSVGMLAFSVWLAGCFVQRTWRDGPKSARLQSLERKLTTPILLEATLRRWLKWQLGRNPIGWLEQRSWSSRLVVWSWVAVVTCLYTSLLVNFYLWQQTFDTLQPVVGTLLAGSLALSAAGSFRRERETGVLELLLVAPLREWQIISGRVRGLWLQFLPAFALLLGVWLYCGTFMNPGHAAYEAASAAVYGVAFLTLPFIGLFFSVVKPSFVSALVWTLLVGIALPTFLGQQLARLLDGAESPYAVSLASALAQLAVALLLGLRLYFRLKHRDFKLQRSSA